MTDEKNRRSGEAAESIREGDNGPTSLSTMRSDRMWAASGYFASLAAIWIVVPVLAYVVRGRHSRFVGFHAVQSVLLQVASIPFIVLGAGLATAMSAVVTAVTGDRRGDAPHAALVQVIVLGVVVTVPLATTVWAGLDALRGQTRVLPILGKWARRVVEDAARP